MASSKVTPKLLIDKNGDKVLFAEAGKEFIDFLFTILALPVGTIIRLLTKNGMVGSSGNLYGSIQNLSETYIQPNLDKDILLKPRAEVSGLLLPAKEDDGGLMTRKYYMCRKRCNYNVADDNRTACPQGRATTTYQWPFVGKSVVNEEKVVTLGMAEGVKLSKASLQSKTVLANFFLKNMGAR